MEKKNACIGSNYSDSLFKYLSSDNPHPDKDKILTYLVSGEWDGQRCSAWNSISGEYESVSLWTDGEWVWDEYLITYFRYNNFKISDAFLQHMKNNNWVVPITFELTLFDSHAIIKDYDANSIILIDTAAPSTIHSSDSLYFCSVDYSCSTNYAGITVEKLSELLGMKITTVLGVDILSNYNVTLDYKNNVAKFCKRNNVVFDGKEYSLSSINGIPIIVLEIEQRPIKLFLDTGAKISYLPKEYTSNFESVGIEPDFHPVAGNFQTECFNIPVKFENEQLQIKFGNLPEQLQKSLSASGINGLVGYDFFNYFKVILDLKNNKMKYAKY